MGIFYNFGYWNLVFEVFGKYGKSSYGSIEFECGEFKISVGS